MPNFTEELVPVDEDSVVRSPDANLSQPGSGTGQQSSQSSALAAALRLQGGAGEMDLGVAQHEPPTSGTGQHPARAGNNVISGTGQLPARAGTKPKPNQSAKPQHTP